MTGLAMEDFLRIVQKVSEIKSSITTLIIEFDNDPLCSFQACDSLRDANIALIKVEHRLDDVKEELDI